MVNDHSFLLFIMLEPDIIRHYRNAYRGRGGAANPYYRDRQCHSGSGGDTYYNPRDCFRDWRDTYGRMEIRGE